MGCETFSNLVKGAFALTTKPLIPLSMLCMSQIRDLHSGVSAFGFLKV